MKLKIDAISNSFNLRQIVNDPTHFSYSGIPSTIDLVFIPSTIEISSYEVLPPVSYSDHNSILFAIPLNSHITTTPTTPHKVWSYNQADFVRATSLLCSIDWLQVLPSSDPNTSWIIFKELFLLIMNCTIPSKLTFPSNKSSLPWINHSYLKCVKTRNSLIISAKKGCSPRLWAKYKSYRNETLAYLRQLKSNSIMLHNTASSISLPFSLIFNSSISSGTFPTD